MKESEARDRRVVFLGGDQKGTLSLPEQIPVTTMLKKICKQVYRPLMAAKVQGFLFFLNP